MLRAFFSRLHEGKHRRLKMLKRQEIDAQFARMSNEASYRQESQLILEEFEISDSEILDEFDK